MKATVRLAWHLLNIPGVIFFAFAVGPLTLGDERAVWRVFSWTLATTIVIGIRAVRFTKLRILDVLPHGHRTLTRALALIAGLWLLVIGAAMAWTNQDHVLLPLAVVFVMWTLIALLVFTWRISVVFRLVLPFAMFAVMVVMPVLSIGRLATAWGPMLTVGVALAAAAAWAWMLAVEKLRRSGADRAITEIRPALPASATDPASSHSAMLTLLHSGRRSLQRLPLIFMLSCAAVFFHQRAAGHGQSMDNYAKVVALAAGLAAILAYAYTVTLPGSARLLWLSSGASRTQLFGIAERTFVKFGLVVLAGWVLATVFALLRKLPVDATQAGLALAAIAATVIAPLYFGLMNPALRKWQQFAASTALLLAWFVGPPVWVHAFGVASEGISPNQLIAIVALLAAILLLRFVAQWCWLRIDWARVRPMLNTRR